jgi:hypothetical protein
MSRNSRLLPVTSPGGSPRLSLILLSIGVAVVVPLGIICPWELLPMLLTYGGLPFLGAVISLVTWQLEQQRQAQWARLARGLGLTEHRERVEESELEPFLDLPLFRFTDPDNNQADSLVAGVVEGHAATVMQMRYAFLQPTLTGRRSVRGKVQTIALFPNVGPLPDFHLADQDNDWDSMTPGWPRELRLGPVVRVVNEYSRNPTVIRGNEEEGVARLFTEARVRQLGKLSGWTVECQDGNLIVYRHAERMGLDRLPYFVDRVLDIVSVLTRLDESSEAPRGLEERIRLELPRRGKDGFFRVEPRDRLTLRVKACGQLRKEGE